MSSNLAIAISPSIQDLAQVSHLLPDTYEIIHNTFGRLRIRVPKLFSDQEYGTKVKYALQSVSSIKEVRINALAQSLIVQYNPQMLNEYEMTQLLFTTLDRADNLMILPVEYHEAIETAIVGFWESLQKEIALFVKVASKNLLQAVGFLCLVIGVIGVIAPLIPGTPFLILSYFCLFVE